MLLGEGGSGKSHTVRAEARHAGSDLWFDLRDHASEYSLDRNVVERPDVVAAAADSEPFELWLDSFDECQLDQPALGSWLGRLANDLVGKAVPASLRIACRTGHWPSDLEDRLGATFGPGKVGVYELLPLTRDDVELAAQTNGLPSSAFLEAVYDRGLTPLAARPLTLGILLRLYQQQGCLPESVDAVYESGCQELLTEDEQRRRRLPGYSVQNRLAFAERLAAMSVLGYRPRLARPGRGVTAEDGLLLPSAVVGHEVLDDVKLPFGEQQLADVLGTGLFAAASPDQLTWVHRSFTEYLAARYLNRHGVTDRQVLQVLSSPDGRVFPQFRELVPWLAGRRPSLARHLVTVDPDLVVAGDADHWTDELRGELVDAILSQVNRCETTSLNLLRDGPKLAWSGLSSQLRPWLARGRRRDRTRMEAIELAQSCKCVGLSADLAAIASDTTESSHVRRCAVAALGAMLDLPQALAAVRAVASLPPSTDPHDEVLAAALDVLWPDHMTPGELLAILRRPQDRHWRGGYWRFIVQFAEKLPLTDLPLLLAWAAEQAHHCGGAAPREPLVGAILQAGAEHIEQPGVAEPFGRAAARWFHATSGQYETVFHGSPFNPAALDSARRREVIAAVVAAGGDARHLCRSDLAMPLVQAADFGWFVTRLDSAVAIGADPAIVALWAASVESSFDPTDYGLVAEAHRAWQRHPALLPRLGEWHFHPVPLGSEREQGQRSVYEFQMGRGDASAKGRRSTRRARRACLGLHKHLRLSESGDVQQHINVVIYLASDHESPNAAPWHMDLTQARAWVAADATTRARIVDSADRFLRACCEGADTTITSVGQQYSYAQATAAASLRLLAQVDPARLRSLPDNVWRHWTPSIVAFHWTMYRLADGEITTDSSDHGIPLMAYERCPAAYTDAFLQLLDIDRIRGSAVLSRSAVGLVLTPALAEAICARLSQPHMPGEVVGVCLSSMVSAGLQGVAAAALTWLPEGPVAPDSVPGHRAVAIAGTLLELVGEPVWTHLSGWLSRCPQFSHAVALDVVQRLDWTRPDWLDAATPSCLAQVYLWLAVEIPSKEVRRASGLVRTTPEHDAEQVRGLLLRCLVAAGAHQEIDWLRRETGDDALSWSVAEARANVRQLQWAPLEPTQLMHLAAGSDRRLARSADELLDDVLESLAGYQDLLNGEILGRDVLWSGREAIGGPFQPQDELYLRDRVAEHLKADLERRLGVRVGCEVGVADHGQSTDIRLSASSLRPGATDHVHYQTVIEVKGCWHRDLRTALESQLCGRYLVPPDLLHGIYLVFWFDQEGWDPDDSRRRQVPSEGREAIRQVLAEQAASVSDGRRQVRAFVIDGSRPASRPRRPR